MSTNNAAVKEALEKLAGVVSCLNEAADILKDVSESNTILNSAADYYYRACAELHRGYTTWLVGAQLGTSTGSASKEKAASDGKNKD